MRNHRDHNKDALLHVAHIDNFIFSTPTFALNQIGNGTIIVKSISIA